MLEKFSLHFLCTFHIFYNEHQLIWVRKLKCELNNDEHSPPPATMNKKLGCLKCLEIKQLTQY